MKFQKGLLNDLQPPAPAVEAVPKTVIVEAREAEQPFEARSETTPPPILQKERLFETLEKETSNARKYLTVFCVVVVLVLVIGGAIAYLTLPGIGDKVRVPAGVEIAVRDHFLTKEKRTATDIIFYKCEGYFGARVGVETRTDIQNPLLRIDTYSARVVANGDKWDISASPVSEPAEFAACK